LESARRFNHVSDIGGGMKTWHGIALTVRSLLTVMICCVAQAGASSTRPSLTSAADASSLRIPRAGSAPGNSYELTQLAPGVFAAVRHVDAGTADSNTMFIVNESDVVVVDTGAYASDARQMIAEIRKRRNKPVRYVINTHHHSDHMMGNQVYLQTFPGVEFIGQARTRELAIGDGPTQDLVPAFRKEIANVTAQLTSGGTMDGAPLTADHRAHLELAKSAFEFWTRTRKA
jgi:hypothetical protein